MMSERAKEWLRRWHAIGGKARNGRSGFTLTDTRYDERISFPLMDELKDSHLKNEVKEFLRPPFDPPARRTLPYSTGRYAPDRMIVIEEDLSGLIRLQNSGRL